METKLVLSNHAGIRASQRNLSYTDIVFIHEHGCKVSNAGVVFRQLRRDRIPAQTPGNHRWRQLVGSTIVLCPTCESFVITVYRNQDAFCKDKKKHKYNWKRQASCCPHCGSHHQAA